MGQFDVRSEPLWAWVCSVSDPQDAINELLNCVLYLLRLLEGLRVCDQSLSLFGHQRL
jgi:hypothetical protein